jgi:hypothetical protein
MAGRLGWSVRLILLTFLGAYDASHFCWNTDCD